MNTGDTAWVLMSTALVMLMTPGLALFYGGMVRRKNVLGILMQCFTILCVLSLQWVLFGYSLAFAPGKPDRLGQHRFGNVNRRSHGLFVLPAVFLGPSPSVLFLHASPFVIRSD